MSEYMDEYRKEQLGMLRAPAGQFYVKGPLVGIGEVPSIIECLWGIIAANMMCADPCEHEECEMIRKRDAAGLRMVLLEAIGAPRMRHVDSATVDAALAAVGIS